MHGSAWLQNTLRSREDHVSSMVGIQTYRNCIKGPGEKLCILIKKRNQMSLDPPLEKRISQKKKTFLSRFI